MRTLWLDDIESLEAISQNEDARRIFLRMAALSQTGRTQSFVVEVALDGDLDAVTKGRLVELAQDESFLLAVEEYLVRTHRHTQQRPLFVVDRIVEHPSLAKQTAPGSSRGTT